MGIALELALGIGNADPAQHIRRLQPLLRHGEAPLAILDIQHLQADGAHRVQRGHRILEHHGQAVAAQRLHLGGLEGEKVPPGEIEAAPGDGRIARHQPHDRERQGRFPRAALAHQPDDAARAAPRR